MADGKPVIGITTGTRTQEKTGKEFGLLALNMDYADRIAGAGGVPIVVPPGADGMAVASLIDGWVLTGGNDIAAAQYGEEPHTENSLEDPRRFALEAEIWKSIPARLPVLGICYGCQFLNVVHGGKLIQHLPDVVGEDRHTGDRVQAYEVDRASRLGSIVGGSATGKSSHHQAVGVLGTGLRITARYEDGTIEAIERSDGRWVVGVQWHPERSEGSTTEKLFSAFIAEATKFRKEKDTCGTW